MLQEFDKKRIEDFFAGISRWETAYAHASLSYFAVEHDGRFVLAQARIFLRITPATAPTTHFETGSMRVGHFTLKELVVTPRELVNQIVGGSLSTPHGALHFPPDHAGHYSAAYMPFHYEGQKNGNRIDVLTIAGAQGLPFISQPQCDWQLKAASRPYDSLNELLFEYLLGAYAGGPALVEVVASPPCEIDLSVRAHGTQAAPAILLAGNLVPDKCRLAFRVFDRGRVIRRESIEGAAMQWESRDHLIRGSAEIEVPQGAVLHCTAIYDDYAHHQGWINDPATVQNPFRAVYEAFDEGMTILRDFLENSQGRGRNARDLEAGIAWLLWMLGFSAAHLGGTARTQEAPDLVATTPRGHFVVIECTTGLLKADNKLPRLIDRAEALRGRLQASGNQHLRVLPVIISSKTRDEVRADLEQAEKLGVLVLTRESFGPAIDRTLVLQDPEQIYIEGERIVRERLVHHSPAKLPPIAG